MRGILSFTTVFPNPRDPHAGTFVRNRLERIGEFERVMVVAPVLRADFRRLRAGGEAVPAWRREGRLEIYHPRWMTFPAAGALNGVLLFLQTVACVWRIGRTNFDVIDVHFGHPEALAAALVAIVTRRPFIVTLRGSEEVHARYPLRKLAMGWALRRASRVLAVSERLRQLAISLGVDPARTRQSPNGVDVSVFHPRDRMEARQRLGIAPEKAVVLMAGNLVPEKGQDRAIAAVRALRRRGIPAELYLAGRPGREGGARYEEQLRELAAAPELAGAVHFLGLVKPPVLAGYMCAADVFCLPSHREGWPNVVHESLACGTPVVATNVGAIPDLVSSEASGYVVPNGDQEALDHALARSFEKAWDREAIAARAGARTWDRVAREVLAELEDVAAGRVPACAASFETL